MTSPIAATASAPSSAAAAGGGVGRQVYIAWIAPLREP